MNLFIVFVKLKGINLIKDSKHINTSMIFFIDWNTHTQYGNYICINTNVDLFMLVFDLHNI